MLCENASTSVQCTVYISWNAVLLKSSYNIANMHILQHCRNVHYTYYKINNISSMGYLL